MSIINDYLIDDMLNLIMDLSNNYYCVIVCKRWNRIIQPNLDICQKCNKIVQIYKKIIWVMEPGSNICHSFHVRQFAILGDLIKKICNK